MSHATLLNATAPTSDEISSRLARNPGVMVLTYSPLLLSFINRQAQAIIGRWHCTESGGLGVGIPNAIMTFCFDLLDTLDDRREMGSDLPIQMDRNIGTDGLYVSLRGVGLPRTSEVDQSRMCIVLEELAVEGRQVLRTKEGESMHHQPSQAEALVLHMLDEYGSLPLEQMTERISELNWSEVFHAVDRLSRKGEIILRRRGFSYHLSLQR